MGNKKRENPSELAVFSTGRKPLVLGLALLVMILSALVAVGLGAYGLSPGEVFGVIRANLIPLSEPVSPDKLHHTIVWDIRLPRVLLAIAVGMALSTAGAVFQGCFRNPLVEPYILGVSSGAAFGAALGIIFPPFFLSVSLSAFLFGALAVLAAYLLASMRGETPVVTLILAGVIIGSLFTALVSILKYIADDSALREIVFWLMGGFYYATWQDTYTTLPLVLLGFLVVWYLGWKLNILSMGDEEALTLGVNPGKYKIILITVATLITALSVATVGVIAWVGLMMPHAARALLGPDHRFMVPLAALMGAIYLIWCDTLARTLTTAEIPVGIITSIVGAPYLLYLLRNKGRSVFSG